MRSLASIKADSPALKQCGPVERSPYHNVLVMRVEDPTALLEAIERKTDTNTAPLYDVRLHRRGDRHAPKALQRFSPTPAKRNPRE